MAQLDTVYTDKESLFGGVRGTGSITRSVYPQYVSYVQNSIFYGLFMALSVGRRPSAEKIEGAF